MYRRPTPQMLDDWAPMPFAGPPSESDPLPPRTAESIYFWILVVALTALLLVAAGIDQAVIDWVQGS